MGIFDRTRKDIDARLDEKAGDIEWDSDRGWTIFGGEPGDAPQDFEDLVTKGYKKNPAVSACLTTKQNAISDAKLRAFRVDDQGEPVEKLPLDHPAERLFRPPNPRDSRVEFFDIALLYFDLGGNVFWRIRRDRDGTPRRIVPIRPDRLVGVSADMDDIPISYDFIWDHTDRETIPAQDLVHIPSVDAWKQIIGVPKLLSARLELRSDIDASDYVSEVLRNHGQPGMVVGVEADVKDTQIERAEERFQEKFGPGKGRGKAAFVSGGKSIQQIGFNLSDLEFPDLRTVTRESVCSVLGVDPIVAGITSASRDSSLSGGEAEEARRKFWKQTVIPMLRRWQSGLNNALAPQFGDNIQYRFVTSHIDALKQDRNEAVQRANDMAEAGVYTVGEIRRELDGVDSEVEDDETVVSGMRTIYRPGSEINDPETAATPQQEGGNQGGRPSEDGDGDGQTDE